MVNSLWPYTSKTVHQPTSLTNTSTSHHKLTSQQTFGVAIHVKIIMHAIDRHASLRLLTYNRLNMCLKILAWQQDYTSNL